MIKLSDVRPVKKISLPSYEGSEIEIYDSLLAGEAIGVNQESKDFGEMLIWLPKLIKSWNFCDDNDAPLEISADNLKKIKSSDIQYLLNQIVEFNQIVKKESGL